MGVDSINCPRSPSYFHRPSVKSTVIRFIRTKYKTSAPKTHNRKAHQGGIKEALRVQITLYTLWLFRTWESSQAIWHSARLGTPDTSHSSRANSNNWGKFYSRLKRQLQGAFYDNLSRGIFKKGAFSSEWKPMTQQKMFIATIAIFSPPCTYIILNAGSEVWFKLVTGTKWKQMTGSWQSVKKPEHCCPLNLIKKIT